MLIAKVTSPEPGVDALVIFDRDGTLSEDYGPMHGNSICTILPGVMEGLKTLVNPKTVFAIATNQSYVGRGELRIADVEAFNAKLLLLLDAVSIKINYIAICPHTAEEGCACRKPNPGMIDELIRISGIQDRERIFFVGDKTSDEKAAVASGVVSLSLQNMSFGIACNQIKRLLKSEGT